jgi:hypothetical protein
MIEENVKVYIKVNENNEIIDIGSSDFIRDYTGWIYIDEGVGDKYRHSQSSYLDNPIINELGQYVYKYENNEIIYVGE